MFQVNPLPGRGFTRKIKPYFLRKIKVNKTCHRDRIAHLTAPCPSHKKLKRKNLNILLMPMPAPMPMPTPGVVQ